ncbi:MAG: hypothetical protein BWY95_02098 [Bacteroidetes bacterium ADurb.BinA104]|nr:MAG: hypothetical protein BWY95_02098 [Bacteroidetes bacterium ADurb.BinA104]
MACNAYFAAIAALTGLVNEPIIHAFWQGRRWGSFRRVKRLWQAFAIASQPPVQLWQTANIQELIHPACPTVNHRIASGFIPELHQTLFERVCNARLIVAMIQFHVEYKAVVFLRLNDPHEVIHLAGCALAWINDMVRQARLYNVRPRVGKPRVGVAPRDASTHRNEVTGSVDRVEVRLLLAVRTILISRYVHAQRKTHIELLVIILPLFMPPHRKIL